MTTTKIELLEKTINSTTDNFIQIKEIEIRKMENIQKLILWIVGLSTGLQLFLLNTVSYSQTKGFTSILFVVSLLAFAYNATSGFFNRKTVNSIIKIELSNLQKLNYQKVILLSQLNSKNHEDLIKDFDSHIIVLKINDLEYYSEQNPKIKPAMNLAKKLSDKMEFYVSIVLVVQFIAIATLLFLA